MCFHPLLFQNFNVELEWFLSFALLLVHKPLIPNKNHLVKEKIVSVNDELGTCMVNNSTDRGTDISRVMGWNAPNHTLVCSAIEELRAHLGSVIRNSGKSAGLVFALQKACDSL